MGMSPFVLSTNKRSEEGGQMSERTVKFSNELRKAIDWLKKNNIEDPDGHLAQKCAKEKIEFIEGRRRS